MLASSRRQASISRAVIETLELRQLLSVSVQQPTNFHVVAHTETSVTVAFNDNSTEESSMGVYADRTSSGGDAKYLAPQVDGADTGERTVTLDLGGPGHWTLYAVSYWTPYSGPTVSARSDEVTLDIGIAAPDGLNVTSNTDPAYFGTTILHWNDNSDNETGFKINESSDGGTTWTSFGAAANATSADLGWLSPGTYQFKVEAEWVSPWWPPRVASDQSDVLEYVVPPTVSLYTGSDYATEPGEWGAESGYVYLQRNTTNGELTVDLNIGGTADASDYTLSQVHWVYNAEWDEWDSVQTPLEGNSVTFAAGENYVEVWATPTADNLVEGDETIDFNLASGSAYIPHSIFNESSVTITDIAPVGPIAWVESRQAGSENRGKPIEFEIGATGDFTEPLDIWFKLSGTAVRGTPSTFDNDVSLDGNYDDTGLNDLTGNHASTFHITLQPGQTSTIVSIPVFNDALTEGNETLDLTLMNHPNANYAIDAATQPSSASEVIRDLTVDAVAQPNALVLQSYIDDLGDISPTVRRAAQEYLTHVLPTQTFHTVIDAALAQIDPEVELDEAAALQAIEAGTRGQIDLDGDGAYPTFVVTRSPWSSPNESISVNPDTSSTGEFRFIWAANPESGERWAAAGTNLPSILFVPKEAGDEEAYLYVYTQQPGQVLFDSEYYIVSLHVTESVV